MFKYILSLVLCFCVFSLLISGCSQKTTFYSSSPQTIQGYLQEVRDKMEVLDQTAAAFQRDQVSVDSLRGVLTKTRLSYKKVEFYITYLYPKYANTHLNGAPLLKAKKSGNQPTVIPPEGLQVLDELIFSENPKEEKVKIAALSKKIKANYYKISGALKTKNLTTPDLITAARMQLVRVFTLSITGFDTPGSANGLQESKSALFALNQLIAASTTQLSVRKKDKVQHLFKGAISFIENNDSFEEFDRLTFLTAYIDPLYKALGGFNNEYSNFTKRTAWNPESESIFATDFLDPYFFSQLEKEEDSEALRSLGKTLFYDTALSKNKAISCATCHKPELAFTDGLRTSQSNVDGKNVLRNSPTLLNAAYAERFFYDVRAFNLEQQAEHVIFSSDEFDTDYTSLLVSLNEIPEYQNKFNDAFYDATISRRKIATALASYVLSLQSFNSEFDQYVRGEITNIDKNVKDGFNIFMGKGACATCHFAPTFSGLVPPLFIDTETEILGVLENPEAETPLVDSDEGRWFNGIDAEKAWIYEKSFKTTTVRNSAATAPYFHNGAYTSLEQVLDFYNKGGGAGIGLEVTNQTLPDAPLDLSDTEIKNVISFLHSLSDNSAALK